MHHDTALIATIAGGFTAALMLGLLAQRLKLPVLVGYLFAGVVVGPFTPGYVADAGLAPQLAEIGVILLMFGVGNHFAPKELLSVRRIALPGAVGQVVVATALGIGVGSLWGLSLGEGLVFGLALSVASTVVLLRALEQFNLLNTKGGRVSVGWLVVEDLIMVIALVAIPGFADMLGGASQSEQPVAIALTITFLKVGAFIALMLVAGTRLIPLFLRYVERTGSRELFILAVLSIGIGIAYAASAFFDASFALGAFLAGMVISESEFSHRAAEEALPLREAFSVLFFVSVGMLIDPGQLADDIGLLVAAIAIVMVGKALAALVIVRILGGTMLTAITVAVALAQIGEFSFILAEAGIALDLLDEQARNVILATAVVSITLNPFLFRLVKRPVEILETPAATSPH